MLDIGLFSERYSTAALQRLNEAKLNYIKNNGGLLDLSMINPDIEPEQFLKDKLIEASLKQGAQRYAVSRGIRKLRAGFAEKYRARFGVVLDPEYNICVTMGLKGALIHLLMCLQESGHTVIVGDPVYPVYRSACLVSRLPLLTFKLDSDPEVLLQNIEQALIGATKPVILLNFPNNPTGIVVDQDFYQRLLTLVRNSGALVINDFVYGEMQFGANGATSILSVPEFIEHSVEVYSLSKAYSVPGWRVGAVVGKKELVSALGSLKSHIDYGVFLPIQHAAAAALTSPSDLVGPTTEKYERRTSTISSRLKAAGWEVEDPAAGCSVWAKRPAVDKEQEEDFSERLLNDTGICVLPGTVFGVDYSKHIRVAAVAPQERLEGALDRICSGEYS